MKATPGERSAGQNEKIKTIIFTYNITDRCCMVFCRRIRGQSKTLITPLTVTPTAGNVLSETTGGTCHAIHVNESDPQAYLPDPNCTPGVIDPAVIQENLETTICKSGYTQTVRPSVTYTNDLKKQQMKDYGYSDTNMSDFEEDHFISLELGGSPTDAKNLWPEPHPSTN